MLKQNFNNPLPNFFALKYTNKYTVHHKILIQSHMDLIIETYSTYMYKTTNSLQVKQAHVDCKLITIF